MSYSLTLNWTAPSPAPANGYRVKYWPTSNPSAITTVTPNVSGTTYTITGLSGTSYAGTVEAHCGGSNYSTAQNFTANYDFYYYTLSKYDCSNSCTQVGTNGQFVGRSTTALSTTSGTHYKIGNFTYVVNTLVTPDPSAFDVDLNTATATGSTCSAACDGSSLPQGSFIIKNTSGSGLINAVYGNGGIYFYILTAGSFPVSTGQQVDGGNASRTGENIIVEISNFSSISCLSLYINGALSGQLQVTANTTYTFTNKTFTTGDTVLIEYVSGICN